MNNEEGAKENSDPASGQGALRSGEWHEGCDFRAHIEGIGLLCVP